MYLLLSCEHATNAIPPAYRHLFEGARAKAALRGHLGYDIGALEIANGLHSLTGAPLFVAEASRLLVDLNRSLHHRRLFSEFSRVLTRADRLAVIDAYYRPYRRRIHELIEQRIAAEETLLHVSVHSFTPQFDGRTRNADIGLLYDSKRRSELRTCRLLARFLDDAERAQPSSGVSGMLRVRRNYPYRGAADGLTTALRRQFAESHYIGIELEVNQRLLGPEPRARFITAKVATALQRVLDEYESR